MNDQSDGKTGPLTDPDDLFLSLSETAVVPASQLRRLVQSAEEQDEKAIVRDPESVRLVVRGMSEPIKFKDGAAILGRSDHKRAMRPDVDLTHYGAVERGVSRQHARLEIKEQRLLLTDLDSVNGTQLRGTTLRAFNPVRVRRGDDVVLGRLAFKILFD